MVQFLMAHWMAIALALSECAAVICQLAFPGNQGIGGFLAGLIKILQAGMAPPKDLK